jgi:glycosyltransferase involved in cell wall biosynthesis
MIPSWLSDRVVFTGFVPFERRTAFFKQADILVHPARHEGWGVVIQEAMASGCPVIGSKETGAAFDLVQDGRNGFLVNADDPEMLYERMKWFVKQPDRVVAMGRQAREDVARYTPESGAERMLQISRSIL